MAQTDLSPQERKVADKVLILSKELLILLGVFTVSLFGFLVIAYRVFLLDKTGADEKAFAFAHKLVNDSMTRVMEIITFFGSHVFLIPANLLVCGYFLLRKKSRYSIKISAIALSSFLIMLGLKFLFNRHRPLIPLLEPARGLSFPSGHAFMSVSFYGLLIWLTWTHVRDNKLRLILTIIFGILIFLIGFSRIYLRVHYTTDVVAGFCLGICWVSLLLYLTRKIER